MTQQILPGFGALVEAQPEPEPERPEVSPWRVLAGLLALWNVRTAEFAQWVEDDSARLRAVS